MEYFYDTNCSNKRFEGNVQGGSVFTVYLWRNLNPLRANYFFFSSFSVQAIKRVMKQYQGYLAIIAIY